MVNPGAFRGTRKDFLISQKPAYAEAVTGGFVADTLADIQRRYFKRYPVDLLHDEEPTDEHLAAVDDNEADPEPEHPNQEAMGADEYELAVKAWEERTAAIRFRKGQIKRWMAYQYMKDQDAGSLTDASSNPFFNNLVNQLSGKEPGRPRKKTAVNVQWRPKVLHSHHKHSHLHFYDMGYTSPTKVARIVELRKSGKSDTDIARQVGVDRTTVPRIFARWEESGDFYHVAPKSGRPRKLGPHNIRRGARMLATTEVANATELAKRAFPGVSRQTRDATASRGGCAILLDATVWRKGQRQVIEEKVKHLAQTKGISKDRYAALRDTIARQLFSQLSREAQEQWEKQVEEESKLASEDYERSLNANPSTDPQARQMCIQHIVRTTQPILDALNKSTGWNFSLLAGGPEPAD
ncbi:hypothetical protein CVT26_009392 [Gymnopilus dilepis]|uniref:Uncharacterized protein n=1 Tax=Gymnopilus dilepis TaxID=231916 RepID=A0A409YIC6_9AGAR|nr:hypothetical protein CVT26_009392 [Gymnopilus dilepis]